MHRVTLPLLLLAGLLAPGQAKAQLPETATDFANHLEFLGYEVVENASNLTARHDTKLDILLQSYQGGVLIQSFIEVVKDRPLALSTANLLNLGAAVTRFYLDSDGDLAIEAWLPGEYDRGRFATFLDAWDADTMGQFRAHADEVRQLVN